MLESWNLELAGSAAPDYYQLRLAWPLEDSKDKVYSLELASDAEPQNAPAAIATFEAAYATGLGTSAGLSLNGEPFGKDSAEPSQIAGEPPEHANLLMGFVYKPGLRGQAAVEKFLVLAFFLLLAFTFT